MNRMMVISVASLSLLISGCASTSGLSRHEAERTSAAALSGPRGSLRRFDIPAGDAAEALNEWSQQGHMQVLFDYSVLHGRPTHAVEGTLPPREALQRMLKDSGLHFSTVNEQTIAVTSDRPQP